MLKFVSSRFCFLTPGCCHRFPEYYSAVSSLFVSPSAVNVEDKQRARSLLTSRLTQLLHLSSSLMTSWFVFPGAMDEEILEALYFAGVPVFDMKSEMSTLDAGWGSPVFHKMGRERLYLVDALLGYDVELLMCDTDMVFLRNPLEYVSRYPQADVLTSSDQLVHTVGDEALERWQEGGGVPHGFVASASPHGVVIKNRGSGRELGTLKLCLRVFVASEPPGGYGMELASPSCDPGTESC
jgi:hypothetical protein